ncbi:receptor-like protein 15 [Solanum stenotomum]|uniref:receptor-like protein 15 n=1 Tax=Solanum stenotomum TaxID=172797 RepID=UPI0020CFEDB7|nr:receptor-like protein 15 [Solanum stenotomum]
MSDFKFLRDLFTGFEKLRQLEILDLSSNYLNRSIFQSLSQLSSLKALGLAENNIESGSEKLSGLDKLEILDLSDNALNDENVLSVLELNVSRTTLKKLDMRNNRFRSFIPNEELGALRNIEWLLLDGNALDENFLRSTGAMYPLQCYQ